MADDEVAALRRWTAEPHVFVRQCLGAEPDPWQDRELKLLPTMDRVAIMGSKGCAKTAFEAFCIWWALTTQPDCNVGAVSTSGDQLRDGLWKELALWRARAPLLEELFHWSPERIVRKTRPGTWFASARTYNRSADANTQSQSLAGLHGNNVFFVIDEAGSVPASLLATADAVLATKQPGDQIRVLIGGNTTSNVGALYNACVRQRQLWHCVHVTSDPDDPFRTPRVSKEWARQQIQAYGRDNPWVKINVFAEFPEQGVGRMLSLADLEAAMARKVVEDSQESLVIGLDVGTVTDAAVAFPRRGRLAYEPTVWRGASTVVIAAEVVRMARDLRATTVFIDAGGPGVGVIDQCRALGMKNVVPVFFGGSADDSTRYANKGTEMHARAAEWIQGGGAIPNCTELVQDMVERESSWNLKGQQILEPKDLLKERLGRSPDWGDALDLTFAYPVAAPIRSGNPELDAIARHMRRWQHGRDDDGGGGSYHEPGFGAR